MRNAVLVSGALFALAVSAPALGAPIFMQFEGIGGEASGGPPGSMEVETSQLPQIERLVSQKAPQGGQGIALQGIASINFTKRQDKASPKLAQAAAKGQHFKRATLFVRKAGGQQEYLVVKLEDCLISSFQAGGTESFSLNFTRGLADYHPPAVRQGAPQATH